MICRGNLTVNNNILVVKSISWNDDIKSLRGTVEGKNISSRGVVFVNNNQIRGINVVSADLHAVNKRQLDKKLSIDGSSVMDGDLKMGGNNILNIRSLSDHKDDDPCERRERDLYSVVNKEYLNTKFKKKDSNDDDFDLRGDVIRNCEPYYDGLFGGNDLVSKFFVDAEISKLPKPETDVLKLDGSRAMSGNLNMGDHAILGVRSSSADNSVITVGGAKGTYLPLSGDRSMQGDLNMGGQPITNMKPFVEDDSSQTSLDAQKKQSN